MKCLLVVLCCVFSLLSPVAAYAENVKLDEIVVTATRTEVHRSQIPSLVKIITDREIEERHVASVSDLLRDVAGLDVIQYGGPGQITSVFIRGAESKHTLVLIDGVRVNSPTVGGFDFANLAVDNIERIEIIKGPLSTLYGSDAIGGVIHILTKRGRTSSGMVSFEGGSFGTSREVISTEVKKDKYDLSLAASRMDTEGFSAAKAGSEKDGYQNTTISSRISISPTAMTRIDITAHLTETKTDLDGSATDDDPNYQQQQRGNVMGITIATPLSGKWEQKLSVSSSADHIITLDEDTPFHRYQIDTGIKTVDWQQNFQAEEGNQLTFGYEWKQNEGTVKDAYSKSFSNQALYLQDLRGLGTPVQLLTGVRWDDSSIYESAVTYRVGMSYLQTEGVKWHAQYGTGFKGPNLNDLFWPLVGNPELAPEKSSGWEVGFEQTISDSFSISLNYYKNVFDDLIQWICDSSFNCIPQNRAKTDSNGIETDIAWRLSHMIQIEGNYTYNDTEDKESHFYLQRRPLNKYMVAFRLNPDGRGQITVNFKHIGKRVEWTDIDFDGTPDQQNPLSAYSKVDLLGSYRIGKTTELFGRIENLFDKKYEEAKGYSTPGFSSYGGLKMSF